MQSVFASNRSRQRGLFRRFLAELDAQSPGAPRVGGVDLVGASSEEVEAASIAWAVRVVDEYRSVVVFSQLLRLLAEAEAPFPCLVSVQRLIGDELRHAKLCAEAQARFDLEGKVDVDLTDLAIPDVDGPPGPRALEIVVRELVVAENESVGVLRAYRNVSTAPAIREVFRVLLRDEVRHAAVGLELSRALLQSVPRQQLSELLERLPDTVRQDVAELRAAYSASASNGPGRRFGASLRPADLPSPVDYSALERALADAGV